MSDEPTSKGHDEGTWVSILVLIGLVILGFFYLPSYIAPPRRAPAGSAAMQNARAINLLMFQYSTDHSDAYPTGKSSTEVFQKLLDEKYAVDPSLFYLEMKGKKMPTSNKLKPENVCWDITADVTATDSDLLPIVFSTGYRMEYVPGGAAFPLKGAPLPLKGQGMAVAYKAHNARFIKEIAASHVVPDVVSPAFPATTKKYQQLTPDRILPP